MCLTVLGVLAIVRAGGVLIEHHRVQQCADALALAVAVGDSVATAQLSRTLDCTIVEHSIVDGEVMVTVRSPWGDGSARAVSGP